MILSKEKLKEEGRERHSIGDYKGAIKFYNRALELDPKFAAVYSFRAQSYRQLKNFAKEIADYGRAIACEPKNAWYYVYRGSAYYE